MMFYTSKKSNPIIPLVLWTAPSMQKFAQKTELRHSADYFTDLRGVSMRSMQHSKKEQVWRRRQANVSFYLAGDRRVAYHSFCLAN